MWGQTSPDLPTVEKVYDTSFLLSLSNDVETNPGPGLGSEGFERTLVEGLAALCRDAPSDTVRSVLGVWSPAKPGNEIRACWSQGKRFLAPVLKGTLAWLTNTKESDIKGTKHEVAEELLIALEALLPDTCQMCKEVYSVGREETPSLSCKGCRQGFHQACYDRLAIGESLAELPGVFSWLCPHCAPLFSLKTVTGAGSRRGNERLRASRGVAVPSPQAVEPACNQATPNEGDCSEDHSEVNDQPGEAEQVPHHDRPEQVPTAAAVVGGQSGGKNCVLYMSGECPFGISGKTGGVCPDKHPKRCMPFMRWGNRSDRGCSGTTCGKAHPTLCPNSLELKCLDRECPWKLHTHKCQRSRSGGSGPLWGGHGNGPPHGHGRVHHQQLPGRGGRVQNTRWGGDQSYQNQGGPWENNRNRYKHPWATPTQGFQGVTAQQSMLGAFNMTDFEQRLQESVTKAIVMAMTSSRSQGVWGVSPGGTSHA